MLRRFSIITALSGLMLAVAATAALAYAPPGNDFVTCVNNDDGSATVSAGVFEPGEEVEVTTPGGQVVNGIADDNGEVTINGDGDLCADEVGNNEIEEDPDVLGAGDDRDRGGAGQPAVDAGGDQIPNTGANAGTLMLGALAALGIGGGALLMTRRNKAEKLDA